MKKSSKQILKESILEEKYHINNKDLKKYLKNVLKELEKKEKNIKKLNLEAQKYFERCVETDIALGYACEQISNNLGTCPGDLYGTEEISVAMLCDVKCDNTYQQCWKEYFYRKVEKDGK